MLDYKDMVANDEMFLNGYRGGDMPDTDDELLMAAWRLGRLKADIDGKLNGPLYPKVVTKKVKNHTTGPTMYPCRIPNCY